jgi:peptide methionine sulfoxide reductase MsrB
LTLRDEILNKKIQLREEKVHWNAMDCDVLIRELTRAQVDKLADNILDQRTKKINTEKYAVMKIIASVYDPDTGKPVFSKADFDTMAGWPASVTDELSEKIEMLNGARADDIEEAVKN